jgi:hypothetical protein
LPANRRVEALLDGGRAPWARSFRVGGSGTAMCPIVHLPKKAYAVNNKRSTRTTVKTVSGQFFVILTPAADIELPSAAVARQRATSSSSPSATNFLVPTLQLSHGVLAAPSPISRRARVHSDWPCRRKKPIRSCKSSRGRTSPLATRKGECLDPYASGGSVPRTDERSARRRYDHPAGVSKAVPAEVFSR